MSLESYFTPARHIGGIGEVSMPRMYPPRLSPEQSRTLDWEEFRNGLEPISIVPLSTQTEIAVVDKTSLWSPSDVCGFVGGRREIHTLEDFTVEEGMQFLKFHRDLVIALQTTGNVHRDQYGKINIAMGFNPQDFQLGAHSIKRLHTHIFTPEHWITDGDGHSEPLRKIVSWKDLDWFNRLKFFEPHSVLFFDFIQYWLHQHPEIQQFLSRECAELHQGRVSLYLKNSADFPNIFADLLQFYRSLHSEHSEIEALFTSGDINSSTDRLLPRCESERLQNLKAYLKKNTWLSETSTKLLTYIAQHLKEASTREPYRVKNSTQAWFTKGFAGTLMFSFDRSEEVRFDIFPRVIATSGVERGVYGSDRPTLINRVEREPTAFETLENEKFLLAVLDAVSKLNTF